MIKQFVLNAIVEGAYKWWDFKDWLKSPKDHPFRPVYGMLYSSKRGWTYNDLSFNEKISHHSSRAAWGGPGIDQVHETDVTMFLLRRKKLNG